jgi:phage-related protein (TIGR01555 family)
MLKVNFPFFNRKTTSESPDRFRADGLADATTGRGGASDYTRRQVANPRSISYREARNLYTAVGFVRNIIDCVPQDSVREWFKITGVAPDDERVINDRYEALGVREKIERLVRAERMSNQGAFLFYGVLADLPQDDLQAPLPPMQKIGKLDYLNVIEDGQSVAIRYENSNEPTRSDYGKAEFSLPQRGVVHPSRLSWMVESWDIESMRGVSVLEVIIDAIIAQDTSMWSVTQVLKELSIAIFKSPTAAGMSPDKIRLFLQHLKIYTDTTSRLLLRSDESYERQFASLGGIKELTDYILDCLAAVARVPKSVIMGKAHGVMTAQEADQLNYYADVSRYQENRIRPVLTKITDLICAEKNGLNKAGLKYEIKFNPLWKLDPKSQAEVDKINSERDAIDIDSGKLAPSEARKLDPRLKDLPEFAQPMRPPVQ